MKKYIQIVLIPFYQLDGFEGLIHVSSSQIVAEVQHGILGGLITISQSKEISHGSSCNHLRDCSWARLWCSLLTFSQLKGEDCHISIKQVETYSFVHVINYIIPTTVQVFYIFRTMINSNNSCEVSELPRKCHKIWNVIEEIGRLQWTITACQWSLEIGAIPQKGNFLLLQSLLFYIYVHISSATIIIATVKFPDFWRFQISISPSLVSSQILVCCSGS